MHTPSRDHLPILGCIPGGHPQRGFSLLQVMLLLMLVGVAVAAGALLLNARRPAEQAVQQQEYLRWADDALAAYAAAHARLPCPATRWTEDPAAVIEDCSAEAGTSNAVGFLPLALLPGAREIGAGAAPIRYSVSRGVTGIAADGTSARQPALSATGDAFIPLDPSGEPFEDYVDPAEGHGNGLDFCAALDQNALPGATADTYATSTDAQGNALNIAYGLVAAGPVAGTQGRFDSTASAALPSPARPGDIDYDDRTRLRTFASLAPLVGCRQYAAMAAADAPTNVSLLSMEVLAGAVANHATVADFQDTNLGNGEAQVRDAAFAQAMAITGLTLSVLGAVDIFDSAVWNAISLTTSVITCIASLGTVCVGVPFDTAAVIISAIAISYSAAAVALNSAALAPIGLALDANVKARDRAAASAKPATSSVADVLETMRQTLYGGTREYCKQRLDPKTKLPVQKKDSNGEPVWQANGAPEFECDWVTEDQPGMAAQIDSAKAVEAKLVDAAAVYQDKRMSHFSDTWISYRMHLGNSAGKYKETVCVAATGGSYDYVNGSCVVLPTESHVGGYTWVTRFKPIAYQDARSKRDLAQRWADIQRTVEELESAYQQKVDAVKQWVKLVDSAHKDAEDICRQATNAESQQVCRNSRDKVTYMRSCTYTVINDDGSTAIVDEMHPPAGQEMNEGAQCTPMLERDRDLTKAALDDAKQRRTSAKSNCDSQSSPYLQYPGDWSKAMMEIDDEQSTFTWISGTIRRYADMPTDGSNGQRLIEDINYDGDFRCVLDPGRCGTEKSTYSYARAYSDWVRARDAAAEATRNRIENETRFKELEAQYNALKDMAPPGSVKDYSIAVGAGAILGKADTRGAVGARKASP